MKVFGAEFSLQPQLPAQPGPARHEPATCPGVTAAAAAAMWLLVLGTLLALTTSTDVISKTSWVHRSLLSMCGPDEYSSAGRCCQRCPAGQYVREPCSSPHTQGECAACDRETYTAFPSGLRSCSRCSSCSQDQEVVAECTSTSNRVCQCQTGRYYRHPDSNEFCVPCSPCPKGKIVLRTCSSTANTVCGLPGPVAHSRHHYFVIGGCLVSVIFIIILFCFKKPEDREGETVYNSLQNGDHDGRESTVPEHSAPSRSLHEKPSADSLGPWTGHFSLDMPLEIPILPRTPDSPAGVDGPHRHHCLPRLNQADYSVGD